MTKRKRLQPKLPGMLAVALLALVVLATAGCATIDKLGPGAGNGENARTHPLLKGNSDRSSPELEKLLEPPTQAEVQAAHEVSAAHTAFTFDLLRELRQHDDVGESDNRFLSPFSIAMALAMTANGADGETLEAMRRTLHLHEMDESRIHTGYDALIRQLIQNSGETELSIANSLWGRDGIEFADSFLETNADFYRAEVQSLPFEDEATVDRINAWVSENTYGKINNIMQGPIDPQAILFLLNAVYFDGNWSRQFDEQRTSPAPFYGADGSLNDVPMMAVDGRFQYARHPDYELVRLPYKGGSMSMYVFVPDKQTEFDAFLGSLSVDEWKAALDSLNQAQGTVKMPRFQLKYEASLRETLEALGMELAFDRSAADFSRIVKPSFPERVFLQEARHKAIVEVTEEGTVAAAVTIVEAGATSASPLEHFELTIDRPFFFVIHDYVTDSILFTGEVRTLDESMAP